MKERKPKEARKSRPIRMTESEWQKCKALGGAKFVRAKVNEAKIEKKESA